ncbi:unnamed protein product [Bursaphelenchus xylophilus]|uniref:(pine wood nematode) hypothetical protein n=1 Tax=Bursaphelenchus xylophilus TaxID=6326 RepID=A0A1I7SRV2_BURXY|nr:unnamed protein product [Bursaphelenchus xylophilus]CAG9101817.1 unnamed protein product [Bursaphelenchus xylophilus]
MKSLFLWTLLVPLVASNVITANLRRSSFLDKPETVDLPVENAADTVNLANSISFLSDLDFSDPEAAEVGRLDESYDHFPKEWALSEAITTLSKKLADFERLLSNLGLTDLKGVRKEEGESSAAKPSDKASSDSAFDKLGLIEVVETQAARFDGVEENARHFQGKESSTSPFNQLPNIVATAAKAADSEFPKFEDKESSSSLNDKLSPSDAITGQIMGISSTESPAGKNDEISITVLDKINLPDVVTSKIAELEASEPLASKPDEMAPKDERNNSSESLLDKINLPEVITATLKELEASETASDLPESVTSTIPESEADKVESDGKSETLLDRLDLPGVITTELAKLDEIERSENPELTNEKPSEATENPATPETPLASFDIADFRSYNNSNSETTTDNLEGSHLSQSPILPLLNHPISGGKFTFYHAQGKGACGLDCGRCSAAISARLFDPAAKWGPSGGKYILKDAVCLGMCVRIQYKGRSASFPIDDKCPECPPNHVDLSEHAFLALEPNAAVGVGRDATITYMFCNQTRISSC